MKERLFYAFIVDTRGIPLYAEMQGKLDIPDVILLNKNDININWPVEGMKNPLKGRVTDVSETTCAVVFPIMEKVDGLDPKDEELGFEAILHLFLKQEPKLKLVTKGSR